MPDVARLQRKILSKVTLVEEPQAIRLLGLSDADPGRILFTMWDHREILRFQVEGLTTAYPLFQFDLDRHRILPGISTILAEKPSGWTDFRFLHWLTTPHMDFVRTPAEAMSSDINAVLTAFRRELEPPCHG